MRLSAFCLVVLALAAPLGAQPYGMGEPGYWQLLSRGEAASDSRMTGTVLFYVHRGPRDEAAGTATVYEAIVFDQLQMNPQHGNFWQMWTETVFNCRNNSYHMNRMVFYDKPQDPGAKARVVWTRDFAPAERIEQDIHPDTMAVKAIKFGCEG